MNSVVLIGRLVRDPELKHTPSGEAVCEFRLAVDRCGDKKDDGTWGAGFFDVSVWGRQAESCGQYLAKGRQCAVSGNLRFHEWEDKNGGGKRSKIDVRAGQVQFLGGGKSEDEDGQTSMARPAASEPSGDFDGADDDIPF